MILDNLAATRAAYENMDERLSRAFDWLRSTDLATIAPDQKVVIDGDRVYAQGQSYETIDPADGRFEAHRNYIDIQIMVSGTEVMYWTPLADLPVAKTPYSYERDVVFFEEPSFVVPLTLRAGDFAVFFPSDGHKPKCRHNNTAEKVHKIVVKIAV